MSKNSSEGRLQEPTLTDTLPTDPKEEVQGNLTSTAVDTSTWSEYEQELLQRVLRGEIVVASMRKDGHPNLIRWAKAEGRDYLIDRTTEWGNPFKPPKGVDPNTLTDEERQPYLDRYEHEYLDQHPELIARLPELRGKLLIDWCAPKLCHGHVLARRAMQVQDQATKPKLDLGMVREWIEFAYPAADMEGRLSVVSTGDWTGRSFDRINGLHHITGYALLDYVKQLDREGKEGIYLRVTTVRDGVSGRGTAEDSVEWVGFWADFDIAGPGHAYVPEKDGDLPLPPDEETVRKIVKASGLPEPTAWVHSGGGIYPWWLLEVCDLVVKDEDDNTFARSIAWQQVLAGAARSLGFEYDPKVHDLSRVLRLPGTINRKRGLQRPCRVLSKDGPRYTLEALEQAVDAAWKALDEAGHLEQAKVYRRQDKANEVTAEDEQRLMTDGEPDQDVLKAMKKYNKAARHHSMIGMQLALLRLGEQEHPGVKTAMDTMEAVFVDDVASDGSRTQAVAQYEWDSGKYGAMRIVLANPTAMNGDLLPDNALETWQNRSKSQGGEQGQPKGELVGPVYSLPDAFWSSRESLARIRRTAHARVQSADAVLYASLTRLSGMVPPATRLDTGIGDPDGASLNLLGLVLGPSGSGKTSAVQVSGKLYAPPSESEMDFADRRPIGTGEGIAEAFMGERQVETGKTNKDGTAQTKWARVKVRDNAFVYADEGEALTKIKERSGATIGETLRRVFVGETLGQQNASKETTRIIIKGTYSLGILIGFQPETVQPLLVEPTAGTPQRFVWCSAVDPNIPDEEQPFSSPQEPHVFDVEPRMMTCAPEIQTEIRAHRLRVQQGKEKDALLDGHAHLTRAKLAALLALLEGRYEVTTEDWDLAEIMWKTSCAVRDRMVTYGKQLATEEQQARDDRRVRVEARAQVARSQAGTKVERIAAQLANAIHEKGAHTRGRATALVAGRDRDMFNEALEHAVGVRWLVESEGGRRIEPGESKPATP